MTTATKKASDVRNAADDAKKKATERAEGLSKADAEFRDAVAKAAKKRADAIAKLPGGGNIAETAWNETKADEDPEYNAVSSTFRAKLDDVVAAVRQTGNADVVGLEAFEARVVELLAEAGTPAGSGALVPTDDGRDTTDAEEAADSTSTKRGKLPDDFPAKSHLEAAGYDTYAKVRGLKGDYSEVEGVGEVRGKEIDKAL